MNLNQEDLKEKNIFNILKMTKSLIKSTEDYDRYIESVPDIPKKERKLVLPVIINNRHHYLATNESYHILNTDPTPSDAIEKYFKNKEKILILDKVKSYNSLPVQKLYNYPIISSLNLYFDIDLSKFHIDKNNLKEDSDPEKILFLIKSLESRQTSVSFNKKIEKILSNQGKTIKLTINSFNVKLINSENIIEKELMIPFIYIPIFFVFPLEDIQLFLSQCLVFSEYNKPNSFIFKSDLLINALKAKLKDNYQLKFFNSKLINHPFQFKLDWITETGSYTLDLSFPIVQFELENSQLNITKFIDFKVILYLIENDIVEWELYLLSYLNDFYKFRQFFKKSFSKYLKNTNEVPNVISLDNNLKKHYNNENSKYYTFILTKKTLTSFIKIEMYSLTTECISREISAQFSFSIQQSRIVENVKNYIKAKLFFKRFVNLMNNGTGISFDLDLFNKYDEKTLVSSVQRFKFQNEEDNKNKLIDIKFSSVKMHLINVKGGNLTISTSKLNKQIRNSLLKQNIEEWKGIIFYYKDSFISNASLRSDKNRDSSKSNNSGILMKMSSIKERINIIKPNSKVEVNRHSKSTIKLINII